MQALLGANLVLTAKELGTKGANRLMRKIAPPGHLGKYLAVGFGDSGCSKHQDTDHRELTDRMA